MRALSLVACVAVFTLGSLAAACGSTDDNPARDNADAGSDASGSNMVGEGGTDGAVGYPAFLPPSPPQVQTYGGAVLKSPKITPVFFSKDDTTTTDSVTDFVSKIGATKYWAAINTEYGVGPASSGTPIKLTAADDPAATIDDTDIQAWLGAKLNGNDPTFGTPDDNTLYAIYYPTGITITLGGTPTTGGDGGVSDAGDDGGGDDGGTDGGDAGTDSGIRPPRVSKSCTSFGGYHSNITLDAAHGAKTVAYAVIPRCPSFFADMNALDNLTGTSAHEFVEAATDPYPQADNPGYAAVDDAHIYWESFLGGGEIGDMCAQQESNFVKFPELAYTVQRSWSNKAAKAGHDPCQPPVANTVYFNTAPNFGADVPYSIGGQSVMVKGVQIAAGKSAVVELDAFSDGPTSGMWTVSAKDQAALSGQTPQLTFTFDKTQVQNGDKIKMTITVVTASKRNHETFVVESTLGTVKNIWIGEVVN